MAGLVLFGIMEGKSSLRELEVAANCDVRCWWLTGGLCPDHSAIGKFLVRHQEVLTGPFFEDLTREVVRRTGSDCSTVAGDGTVIEAMSSRMRRLTKEAAEQNAAEAAARAQAEPEDRAAQREAERAKKEADAVERRIEASERRDHKLNEAVTCPTDPDSAVNQTKRTKAKKPSYVPSVLANEDRIITAQTVDPTSETEVVESLVAQSERVSGQKVEDLLLDGGYFCAVIAVLCMTQDINLLCPSGRVEMNALSSKKKNEKYSKDAFHYKEDRDQYICPAGQALTFATESKSGERRQGYRRYRCASCGGCSYRERCTTDSKGRSIKRFPEEALLEAEKEVMKHPKARARYRRRKGMVEPVFSEQRGIQGLNRFRRRGLPGVKLEYALHSAAHNTRRYLALDAALRRADSEPASRQDAASTAVLEESIAPQLPLCSIRGGLARCTSLSVLVRLEQANMDGYGLRQAA